MKRFILLLVLGGLGFTGFSQKVYFIYLQSEPVQPFYVKLSGKLQSSSAGGYLILSRLVDSTYSFAIGFIQPGVPEQTFTVKMAQKDHGFILKNFGDKGWGIVDLQSLNIQYADTRPDLKDTKNTSTGKDVSPFTDLLSKATGDPSLREQPPAPKVESTPVAKTETVSPDRGGSDTVTVASVRESIPAIGTAVVDTDKQVKAKSEQAASLNKEPEMLKTEPVAKANEERKEEQITAIPVTADKVQPITDTVVKVPQVQEEKKPDVPKEAEKEFAVVKDPPPVNKEQESPVMHTKSVVTKRSESSTTEGFGLVFFDIWEGGKVDTIRLLIPNPKQVVVLVKETPRTEKKFLDIQAAAVKTENTPVSEEKPKQVETVQPMAEVKAETKPVERSAEKPPVAGSCTETATDTDFFALRKLMASAEGDDEMIAQAKKYFKQKCFTVSQLKNLGALFLNDEARYNFFDAAYKYTVDKTTFTTLEAELKDPYYINRFKAMIQ